MNARDFGFHVDAFGYVAQLEFEIEAKALCDFDGDAGAARLLEAGSLGCDFVVADGNVGDDVGSGIVRRGFEGEYVAILRATISMLGIADLLGSVTVPVMVPWAVWAWMAKAPMSAMTRSLIVTLLYPTAI